ncbi:PAS domain S-box protein [Candidatus Woesearchaeota archaeon]|nr:PAS domain S-box protein [Candidatus Woesearchaeota archaeon]
MPKKNYQKLNTTLIHNLKTKINELRESEKKFRAVFDWASDGIIAADPKTKKFLFVNPQARRLTGYTEKELLNKSIPDIHPKKDLPYVLNQFRQQITGKITIAKDIPLLRKDNKVVYCDINASVMKIGKKEVIAGFFRDITEKKKKDDEIMDLNQKIDFILGETKTGLSILDSSFNIIYIDPLWEKTLGAPKGRKCYEYFVGRKTICPNCGLKKAKKTNQPSVVEEFINKEKRWAQVTTIPFKDNRGKTLFAQVSVDIDERKKAEEKLKESEEKWRSLVQNAPNMIIIVDRKGIIQFINRTTPGMDVKGISQYDYIDPEHHSTVKKAIKRVFNTGRIEKYIIKGMGPKSNTAWYKTKIGPLKKDGRINEAILITTDITEQKKAEQKIIQQKERYKKNIEDLKKEIIRLKKKT